MGAIREFEDLQIWQDARALVNFVFGITRSALLAREPGFRSDVRKNAVGPMNNIAEGFDRGTDREFAQYLKIARSTVGELRSQLYVLLDQQFIGDADFAEARKRCKNLSRRISCLIRYLETHPLRGTRGLEDS